MDRKKVEERRRLERGLKDVNWRRQRDDDVEEVNNKMLLFIAWEMLWNLCVICKFTV